MTLQVVSIIILAAMFVLATWRGVNMGLLGFVAAACFGMFGLGLDIEDSLAGFPVDLFVALVGLTYLFGFAQNNGVIDVIVGWCLRALRGRVGLAPWIFFWLTAALIAAGALFAVAIVAPLALRFARRNRLNSFMTGLLVVHGALAGAFSPISVYGIFINDYLTSNGFATSAAALFVIPLIFNLVFAAVVWLVLRNRPGPQVAEDVALAESGPTRTPLDCYQILTLIGLLVMAVAVIGFGADIGVTALAVAIVLAAWKPKEGRAALSKVSWPVVVLICGVLCYITMLQEAGTVDWVSAGIAGLGVPLVAALLLFYVAGLVSALASSLGIIGVVIALAGPFLASGEVNVIGFVVALAIAATIVDISPFSTNGAMLLANVDERVRERYYRQMLIYAGLMCLIGPGLAWLITAVPTVLA